MSPATLFRADPEDNPVPFDQRRPGCDCCGSAQPPTTIHTNHGTISVCPVCRCNAAGEA